MKFGLLLRIASLTLLAFLAGLSPASPPTLRVIVTGGAEALNVIVIRDKHDSAPFTVDPSRANIVMTPAGAKPVRLSAQASAVVTSREWPAGTVGVGDGAYVTYALDTLPNRGNVYALSFDDGAGVRDANGSLLRVSPELFPKFASIPATARSNAASVVDVDVERLRAAYLGRTIYITGGFEVDCIAGPKLDFDPGEGARVIGISRARGTSATWTLGGTYTNRNGETPASYLALDPIVVTIATPRARVVAAGQSGIAHDLQAYFSDPQAVGRNCPRSTFRVADKWEFDRLIRLRSPYSLDGASAQVLKAVHAGTVIVGMRRSTVASVWGYPSQFGTPRELDNLDEWRYESPTPQQHSVKFVDDRVVAVVLPRHLP